MKKFTFLFLIFAGLVCFSYTQAQDDPINPSLVSTGTYWEKPQP